MFRRNFSLYTNRTASGLFRPSLVFFDASTGTLRTWREGAPFGFITDDATSDSIFVHRASCIWEKRNCDFRSIAIGTRLAYDVSLDLRKGDGKKRCTNVTLEDGSPLPDGPHRDIDRGHNKDFDNNDNNNNRSDSRDRRHSDDRDSLIRERNRARTIRTHRNEDLGMKFIGKQDLVGSVITSNHTYGFIKYVDRVAADATSANRAPDRAVNFFYHTADIITAGDAALSEKEAGATTDVALGDGEEKKEEEKKSSEKKSLPTNFIVGDEVVFDVIEDDRRPGVARATNLSLKIRS